MLFGLELSLKEWLAGISVILAILNYLPYLIGSIRGTKKPHIFTWSLWLILTSVAFFAQLEGGGGMGAWATGTTAVIILFITLSALRSGLRDVRLFDWFALAGAVFAIVLWIITSSPFWSVILISLIHSLCFLPTFRKGYANPQGQSATAFILTILKYGFAIAALSSYSVETVLFPATIMTTSFLFVSMIYYRNRTTRSH